MQSLYVFLPLNMFCTFSIKRTFGSNLNVTKINISPCNNILRLKQYCLQENLTLVKMFYKFIIVCKDLNYFTAVFVKFVKLFHMFLCLIMENKYHTCI